MITKTNYQLFLTPYITSYDINLKAGNYRAIVSKLVSEKNEVHLITTKPDGQSTQYPLADGKYWELELKDILSIQIRHVFVEHDVEIHFSLEKL
jgi:hypothetical protein